MASAKNRLQANSGFTLIEIMVVVVIIALLATFFVTSLSSNLDRNARLEAQRFMAVINEVRDESIIAGEIFILSLDEKSRSYSFSSPRTNRLAVQDSGLLKTRGVKQGIKIDWEVLEQFANQSDEAEGSAPRVLISPLGEITPFDVRFHGEELDYHVFVNDENQLQSRADKSLR